MYQDYITRHNRGILARHFYLTSPFVELIQLYKLYRNLVHSRSAGTPFVSCRRFCLFSSMITKYTTCNNVFNLSRAISRSFQLALRA